MVIANLIAWAKSLMSKPADRSEITRWVEQNMPQHHKNEDKS